MSDYAMNFIKPSAFHNINCYNQYVKGHIFIIYAKVFFYLFIFVIFFIISNLKRLLLIIQFFICETSSFLLVFFLYLWFVWIFPFFSSIHLFLSNYSISMYKYFDSISYEMTILCLIMFFYSLRFFSLFFLSDVIVNLLAKYLNRKFLFNISIDNKNVECSYFQYYASRWEKFFFLFVLTKLECFFVYVSVWMFNGDAL